MKLIFVSSGQYPDGGAATNRHLAYAKGLKELGHEIEFILLNKQKSNEKEFVYGEIKFICVYAEGASRQSKLKKIQSHLKSINKSKEALITSQKKNNISALILLDTNVSVLLPLIKQGKKLGLKIFHERTEYPSVVAAKSILGKIDLNLYLKYAVKKFDGIYVINKALKKYFEEITDSKIPVVIVNMIVDPERFESVSNNAGSTKTIITYCGTLDGDKDGVPILIESFTKISGEFPNAVLQLIGSLDNETTKQKIKLKVSELNIKDKVIFTGSVKREQMPGLLKHSDILALARPANKQAEGGFPTKLGEYLATGNPVVVTNVGEIGIFLKDKVNAFISEPDSSEKFSQKLREAIVDPNKNLIGIEGKKLVYNEFNYLTQAKLMEKMFLGK
jgi:glycosyltransferase involved in cell wall biosynthesis